MGKSYTLEILLGAILQILHSVVIKSQSLKITPFPFLGEGLGLGEQDNKVTKKLVKS